MFGFLGGPQPPSPSEEVLEDRPKGMSEFAARQVWIGAYNDGRSGREHKDLLAAGQADMLDLYGDGFATGRRDKEGLDVFSSKVEDAPQATDGPAPAEDEGEAAPSPPWVYPLAVTRELNQEIRTIAFAAACAAFVLKTFMDIGEGR